MTKSYRHIAGSLLDGGWTHEDKDELMREYGFTPDEADEVCDELLALHNRNTYNRAVMDHREVAYTTDGISYKVCSLTQDAYLCGGSYPLGLTVLKVWFQAEAIDTEGNRYLAVWRPAENWDPADDDEDYACDWPWPDEVKAL